MMELLAILLGLVGLTIILRYSEGEFAGTAQDEGRRIRLRRVGMLLVLVSLLLRAWLEFG